MGRLSPGMAGDERIADLVAAADAADFKTGVWKIERDVVVAALGEGHPSIVAADQRADRVGGWWLNREFLADLYRHGWEEWQE